MVRMSRAQKFTEQNGLPHTVAEWYVRHVHENLQNKNHTVVEWYVRRAHENLQNKNGLPHTVAEWYVCRVHENLLTENGMPSTVVPCITLHGDGTGRKVGQD